MKNEQRRSDAEWIRSIVDAHAGDLTRFAASIMGDMESARDVVQDVFIRLWKEPREQIEDHVRPWLFRVCRNRALDLRRKGGRMRALTELDTAQAAVDAPGPESMAERKDSHSQIMDLLEALPENQRVVVRLKFQNGMSYKEIATVTDLSVTNVGYLLHTAIQTLRTQAQAVGE